MREKVKLACLMSAVCLALVLLAGYPSHGGPIPQEGTLAAGAQNRVVSLDQGWKAEQQQRFWFTSQGAQLVPYDWFLALEQEKSTELIRSDANLVDQLGFLQESRSPANPDGLPVGFAKDKDSTGVAWLGLSCAGCHTNQIETGTASLRIDGAPTLSDTYTFFDQVARGLDATEKDDAKFDRFARKVLGQRYTPASATTLRDDVGKLAQARVNRQQENEHPVPYGHGRADALGQIFNQILVQDLNIPENVGEADAPVSYPFLWDTPYSNLAQWPGILPNTGAFALARDAGELLGVFGTVDITPSLGFRGYQSSAKPVAMGALQKDLKGLWSPLWPAEYLPPLDSAKVSSGQTIYGQQCAGCHALLNRTDPKRQIFAVMTPVDGPGTDPAQNLGTDPTAVDNALNRMALTGPLKGHKMFGAVGKPFGTEASGIQILTHVTVGVLLGHKLADVAAVAEAHTAHENVPTFVPRSYKARPLNGIWATAPYLHNGSVPNLWELLKPPAERIQQFKVGSRRFDPVHVGFDTASGPSPLDTRLRGNSNAGHAYGTKLTDEEKWALIEYLKSL